MRYQAAAGTGVVMALAVSFLAVLDAQPTPVGGDLGGPADTPLLVVGIALFALLVWAGITWGPRRVQ